MQRELLHGGPPRAGRKGFVGEFCQGVCHGKFQGFCQARKAAVAASNDTGSRPPAPSGKNRGEKTGQTRPVKKLRRRNFEPYLFNRAVFRRFSRRRRRLHGEAGCFVQSTGEKGTKSNAPFGASGRRCYLRQGYMAIITYYREIISAKAVSDAGYRNPRCRPPLFQ